MQKGSLASDGQEEAADPGQNNNTEQDEEEEPDSGLEQPSAAPAAGKKLRNARFRSSDLVVPEKFRKETLVEQLYDDVATKCGKYAMNHFPAHISELAFESVANKGHPSYGKTEELKAFEKAGGAKEASASFLYINDCSRMQVKEVTRTVFASNNYNKDGTFDKQSFMKYFELRDAVVCADEVPYIPLSGCHEDCVCRTFSRP